MSTLTETAIRTFRPKLKPYKRGAGGGLFSSTGSRLWRLKYRHNRVERLLALGAWPEVTLKEAREKRDEARRQIAAGEDPATTRRAFKESCGNTFAAVATECQERRRASISASTFTKGQWLLDSMIGPSLGSRPIARLKASDVLTALRRIEARGTHETAHRARQIAGQVFRYAVATGRAERAPTADLRGALTPVSTKNRAAVIDPAGVGALLRALHGYVGQPTVGAALKLAPLLFVRPGELRNARWEEFDLDGTIWRIPGERMKMGKPHVVPLASQAVDILRQLHSLTGPHGLLL
jgi:integrase